MVKRYELQQNKFCGPICTLPSYTNIRPISFSQVAKLENPPDKVPWQERLTCKRLKQAVQVAE